MESSVEIVELPLAFVRGTIKAFDADPCSIHGFFISSADVTSASARDVVSLIVCASGIVAFGESMRYGLTLPLGSGKYASLAGELKCGVLSTLELWISPLSCALRLLFLASILGAGLDASLAPDSDTDVGYSD